MPSYHVVTLEGKVQKTCRQEVRALRWLPEKVEIPLRHIAQAARKGLLALSIQVGLAVLQATMENEVAERVGPKGKHRPDRQAYRHGNEEGWAVIADFGAIASSLCCGRRYDGSWDLNGSSLSLPSSRGENRRAGALFSCLPRGLLRLRRGRCRWWKHSYTLSLLTEPVDNPSRHVAETGQNPNGL